MKRNAALRCTAGGWCLIEDNAGEGRVDWLQIAITQSFISVCPVMEHLFVSLKSSLPRRLAVAFVLGGANEHAQVGGLQETIGETSVRVPNCQDCQVFTRLVIEWRVYRYVVKLVHKSSQVLPDLEKPCQHTTSLGRTSQMTCTLVKTLNQNFV